MRRTAVVPGLMLLAAAASWTRDAKDVSPHRSRVVVVANGVELEVLDWGGSGPPIVFLAGLGNTAHVFDHFAPQFAERARVLGVTRRGFGISDRPPTGYDIDTLVEDVRDVLDAMEVARATLVAHSFGGDEITRFAARFPDRVRGLVFLDAAHDRSGLSSLAASVPYPPPPSIAPSEAATLEGWIEYLTRFRGVGFPPGELLANLQPSDSSALRPRDDGEAMAAILNGIEAPDLHHLRPLPTLAIFALPASPADMFPYLEEMTPPDRRQAHRVWTVYHAWERDQISRFQRCVPGASVEVIDGGNHLIFLSHPERVARLITPFLDRVPPADTSAASPTACRGL